MPTTLPNIRLTPRQAEAAGLNPEATPTPHAHVTPKKGHRRKKSNIQETLERMSPELQGKWNRVKARFHAVSQHLEANDLKINIQWSNGVGVTSPGGTTTTTPGHRRVNSVTRKLTKRAKNSKYTTAKHEPIVVQARQLFDVFDQDGNGSLDRLEFKRLIRSVGGDVGLSSAEFSKKVKKDFAQVDVGGDSEVSFAEFHRYYRFLHKEFIAKRKRKASAPKERAKSAAKKDSDFFSGDVQTLDDAIRADNVAKVQEYIDRGDHFASGGVVPVVLAAHLGRFEITQYLATNKEMDASLLDSEREAIVALCTSRDHAALNGLMHDLYTQACERLKVLESLNNDNLDSARDNLKLTYYKNWGQNSKLQNVERASNVYKKNVGNKNEALITAAENNQLLDAENLLRSAVDPNWQDAKGSTALMSATWFGYLDMCKLLVLYKADVCTQNRRKNTAMHFAAEKHHRKVIYFFLSEKCEDGVQSLRIKNCLGNTPTRLCKDIFLQDMLIAARPPELKEKINRDFRDQKKTGAKKDGYRNKAAEWIGVAARENDLVSMQQHMGDFGPKQQQLINTPDFLGMYPLHYAVACAKSPVVKTLLDCKADISVRSRTGNTPLHYAYNNGKRILVQLLEAYSNGVDTEALLNTYGTGYPTKSPTKPSDMGTFS